MSDFANAYRLLAGCDSAKWDKLPVAKQKLLTNKLIEVRNLLITGNDLTVIDDLEYLQINKEAGVRSKPVLKRL